MQNVNAFVDVNKNCNRYKEITEFLEDHEQLFDWQPEEVVLDAGCGPGDITADVLQQWLPQDFRSLVGVDVSHKMIKHARRTYSNSKLAFYTVDIGADVTKILQNQDHSQGFNKVFSFCVLHWLSDLQRGISNLHFLLTPGGQALFSFPVDRFFQNTFKTIRARPEWSDYFQLVDRKLPSFPLTSDPAMEFRRMMTSSGFHVQLCQVKERYTRYESSDHITGLIESLDQDIDCVPQDLKTRYLDDCLQIMTDLGAVNSKKTSVKQMMLTCFARKAVTM